ncbi:TonB-dependent receptor [Neisseriaceae bacterium ESL0693]|nr:TonB-dependent receptor [Neisseriaceae bacterium ESL0693]
MAFASSASKHAHEFELGQIEVTAATVNNTPADEQVMKRDTLEKRDAHNIAEALNTMPGVNIDFIGGRNETGLQVRGFDSRQVPIFLDGIPQYVPYDGYVDFARFLTTDLSEIRLSKSGTSLLYGANTLGGAINLVSRKPVKAFEFGAASGINSSGDKLQSFNLGSNTGLFYAQGNFGFIDSHKFRLPKHFKDEKARPTDEGHYRQNAQYLDRKYGFKIGLIPDNGDEYAIGYSAIRSEKGQPAYVGDEANTRAKYWRWPQWDKDSYYFLGNTHLGDHNRIQLRLFHDSYKNRLDMYRNAYYSALKEEPSIYHDKTVGGSINWINTRFTNQLWQLSYQYKRDEHHDFSSDEVYKDATQVLATENKIRLTPQWQLRWGVSHERQYSRSLPAQFAKASSSSTNALAELSYQLNQAQVLYGNVSARSRFPTLKDRYSYRMGKAIPNAGLRAEKANSVELGWKGQFVDGLDSQIALFYSRLRNEIQSVYVADTQHQCPAGSVIGYCSQEQNMGKTRHAGIEVSLDKQLNPQYKVGINYTYLQRKNLNDHHTPLLNTPKHKVFAYTQYQPVERLTLLASAQAEKGRQVSYGNQWRTLSGFVRLDSKMVWQPNKKWQVEAGVQNLTDKNYELSDGYPMAGRTWFANLRYAL